jgi:hypothetical protein
VLVLVLVRSVVEKDVSVVVSVDVVADVVALLVEVPGASAFARLFAMGDPHPVTGSHPAVAVKEGLP